MRARRENKSGDCQHLVHTNPSNDKGNAFVNLLREIQLGNYNQISKLITATLIVKTDSLGWTLLHHAAFLGRIKISKILLNERADVNSQDLSGYTPLHLSSSKNNIKLSWFLIKHGARTDLRDHYGRTPAQMVQSDILPKEFELWSRLYQRCLQPPSNSQCDFYTPDITKNDDVCVENGFENSNCDSYNHKPMLFSRNQEPYDGKLAVKVRLWKNPKRSNFTSGHPIQEPVMISPILLKTPSNSSIDHQQKHQRTTLKLLWVKTKRIAKWQMMAVAVRLLLCYLLELVVDHTKHILYSLVLNYSLLDLLYIVYDPSREFLYPLCSFLSPVLSPIYSLINAVLEPFYQILRPFSTFIQYMLRPIINLYTASLKFMILRLQWVVVPAYRYLVEPFLHMALNFIKWLYTAATPISSIFSKALANIYYFLNLIFLYTLHPMWQTLLLFASAPWESFRSRICKPLAQVFKACIKRLLEKTLNSIRPMLNIQGFFSKVFGPLVSGLKAILHWLLPNWLIRPIEYLSSLIFGEINNSNNKQTSNYFSHSGRNSHTTTEETALMVIFVFIVVTYGSILGLGYVFKIIYGISVFLNLPFHSRLRRLVTTVVLGDRILESKQADVSSLSHEILYWLGPDWTHHQLGILMLVLSLLLVMMFKLTRCIFGLFRKICVLFITSCLPESVKHIMPVKRMKHKMSPIKPSSIESLSLLNSDSAPIQSKTKSLVKFTTLSLLSSPSFKSNTGTPKGTSSPTITSSFTSSIASNRPQKSNSFALLSFSGIARPPQHNI